MVSSMDDKSKKKKVEFFNDRSSLLSLQPWVFRKESEEKMGIVGEVGSSLHAEVCSRNVSIRYDRDRKRSSLRSKNSLRYSVKPVVSAGNCLIPQLYDEDLDFGELGVPNMRPLVITDGRRIISKSTYDHSCIPVEKKFHVAVDGVSSGPVESVDGIPPLPLLRTPSRKRREVEHPKQDTINSLRTCKSSHSQDSPDRALLYLGISIGVVTTMISHKREIERLNGLLKHKENLVQDLQEELDMKEALTVNELPDEALESKELNGSHKTVKSPDSMMLHNQSSFPSEERDGNDLINVPNPKGNSDLSKIEAELEAELERLELDMNATSLEARISALDEMDPDFVGDIVQGELRAGQFDAVMDDTSETENPNYAVSAHELSLRLHELVQSRLEERVKELENALRSNQKQIEFMEAEKVVSQSQRSFTNSEMGPSTGEETPVQPFCLNLSGDALNAYAEVYEEFMRFADTPTDTSNEVKGDEVLNMCLMDEGNYFGTEERWEHMLSYSDDGESDDEEEKLLIQKIIEKTRKGFPVVTHAQRMLCAMED